MKNIKRFVIVGLVATMLLPGAAQAQQAYQELQSFIKAKVIEIESESEEIIPGTDTVTTMQQVRVKLLDSGRAGEEVVIENDLVQLKPGDDIFVTHVRTHDGFDIYLLKDVNRQLELVVLVVLFIVLLLAFAGWQGIRALTCLGLSIAAIIFLLVPALLNGYDPILASLGIAGVILALALFGTHGFNAVATTAFVGTFGAVALTSFVALVFVGAMRLTGFASDAVVALNFATSGTLDLPGLLLGSIIIGVLGVLDDVSITQASVVAELKQANDRLHTGELYRRALRVGRDHVSSLVNTLALAYVGAALPIVLLFSTSDAPIGFTLNQEIIAAELARIIVGSIGLILAVPFTTFAAAWWFGRHTVDPNTSLAHGHHH